MSGRELVGGRKVEGKWGGEKIYDTWVGGTKKKEKVKEIDVT